MSLHLPVDVEWHRNDQIVFDTLHMAVQYAYGMGVEGDIIEFGAMPGNSACALAHGIANCDAHHTDCPTKNLWLMDSFSGLPQPVSAADLESPHVKSGVWAPGTLVDLNETHLAERLRVIIPDHRVNIVKGWFIDTVEAIGIGTSFSCIHVDCDLYESTIHALAPLFAKNQVSEGAIILFDDWNCNRASGRFGERKAWYGELIREFFIQFSDEGSYGIAGHKFIIHSYKS